MKTGGKIFLVFLLLLAIAGAAFFLLSRDKDEPAAETPSPSPSESVSPSIVPEVSETPGTAPEIAPTASPDEDPDETPAPPENLSGRPEQETLHFQVQGEDSSADAQLVNADFGTGIRGFGYSLYCIPDSFAYKEENNADLYYSLNLEDCGLQLSYIPGTDVDLSLPTFLDSYLNYREIEYTGSHTLADSLYTEGMVASDGSVTYEAYLANADGGMMAFILFYPNEQAGEQAPRLHAMLDSFAFHF